MLNERTNALAHLRRHADELKTSKVVYSGSTLKEDRDQTGTLANTDGNKSWLPGINKWFEAIETKVREQLILS